MAGALDGFRIFDLTQMICGPVATMLLGEQGADVTKIRLPGGGDFVRRYGGKGGGLAPMFVTTNRNKRSFVLNLRAPRGLDVLLRLVAGADVFVQNFRTSVVE